MVSSWVDYEPWLRFKASCICSDVNSDTSVSVSDVVHLINYLFKGEPEPLAMQVADVNSDGDVTVSDAIYLINNLFKGGPTPCS